MASKLKHSLQITWRRFLLSAPHWGIETIVYDGCLTCNCPRGGVDRYMAMVRLPARTPCSNGFRRKKQWQQPLWISTRTCPKGLSHFTIRWQLNTPFHTFISSKPSFQKSSSIIGRMIDGLTITNRRFTCLIDCLFEALRLHQRNHHKFWLKSWDRKQRKPSPSAISIKFLMINNAPRPFSWQPSSRFTTAIMSQQRSRQHTTRLIVWKAKAVVAVVQAD